MIEMCYFAFYFLLFYAILKWYEQVDFCACVKAMKSLV